ncbi:MAG: hypothetical protein ACREQX_14010 [Candidatus Binataceae bacterium]
MSSARAERAALKQVTWGAQANGIELNVTADANLNSYDSRPHTVVLGVYQSQGTNVFLTQLATQSSIASMLEAGHGGAAILKPGPGQGILLDSKSFIVTPGREATLTLDRVANARFVGLLVGYYSLDPVRTARLFAVPLVVKTSGIIFKSATAAPGQLKVALHLGPEGISTAARDDSKLDGKIQPLVSAPMGQVAISDARIRRALIATQSVNPPAK